MPLFTEPLQDDELQFLCQKLQTDTRLYVKTLQVVLLFFIIIPALTAMIYFVRYQDKTMMWQSWFLTQSIAACLFLLIVSLSYWLFLRPLRADIHQQSKIIELCLILEKKYMPTTKQYFFTLNSTVKNSIEVSEADFARLNVNDEINIEYAPKTKTYFGYF
jgi:hypothetical protein